MRLPAYKMLLIGLTLFFNSCETKAKRKLHFTSPLADTITTVKQISLKDLRKTYKSLHGKLVETEGIVWYQFENVSICPNRNALFDEVKKRFWLDFHQGLDVNDSLMQAASGSHFKIRGTIDTSRTEHFGMYLGTIKSVYFMQQN